MTWKGWRRFAKVYFFGADIVKSKPAMSRPCVHDGRLWMERLRGSNFWCCSCNKATLYCTEVCTCEGCSYVNSAGMIAKGDAEDMSSDTDEGI